MSVNELEAANVLRSRFGEDVGAPAAIGQGEWSKAYRFRHATAEYVIRFSLLSEDFEKDLNAAQHCSADLPIPPVVELGEALGGFYAISQFVPGNYLDDVGEPQMRSLLPRLFAALDAIRLVDISASRGYGIWTGDGNAPSQSWSDYLLGVVNDRPTDRVHGWRERLASSTTGIAPFNEAFGIFETLVHEVPEDRYLVHSDLLHFNVLVSDDEITAVIDWGDSKYGDFLYDVAWFAFWSAWYRAWEGINFAAEARRHFDFIGTDVPNFEERLRCYQLHIGLSGQAYCAFAGHWDDLEWTARRTLAVFAAELIGAVYTGGRTQLSPKPLPPRAVGVRLV
jgi:hygromycin-B 4-O-kinase